MSSSDRSAAQGRQYPTAIEGTWGDLEARAWFVYENLTDPQEQTANELAEAVLVLLGEHRRSLLDA